MRLAVLASVLVLAAVPAFGQGQVNVYNWSDYIADAELKNFEKNTGIKVNYTTYDSNEILDAKLKTGRSGYDIVVPTASPFFVRQLAAGLFLPLAPRVFMAHKIQFTYSRSVPCVAGAAELACIEIVLRAVPDPDVLKADLDALARSSHLASDHLPRLWSVTTMRLVTDPATLRTYSRETRWHAYWSDGVSGPEQSLFESEKTLESMSTAQ